MTDTPTNLHPADQLALVRAQIAALRAEEAQLRLGFIDGTLDLVGDQHCVVIERKTVERIDLHRMRQQLNESIWSPYLVHKEIAYITVRKRGAEQ